MAGTSLLMAGDVDAGVEELQRSLEIARREGNEVFTMSALSTCSAPAPGEMMEFEPAGAVPPRVHRVLRGA